MHLQCHLSQTNCTILSSNPASPALFLPGDGSPTTTNEVGRLFSISPSSRTPFRSAEFRVTNCYGLHVCVPRYPYIKVLACAATVAGSGACGRWHNKKSTVWKEALAQPRPALALWSPTPVSRAVRHTCLLCVSHQAMVFVTAA